MTLKERNLIPEGKAAWIPYQRHVELSILFENNIEYESVITTARIQEIIAVSVGINTTGLSIAETMQNAWTLIRRGYLPENLSLNELDGLAQIFAEAEEADIEDMELHEEGSHRALYNYITKTLGLYVEAGRGPVWHRAKRLIDHDRSNSIPA